MFDAEPLPMADPLRLRPNVLLWPHLGCVTAPVYQRFAAGVTECLEAWLAGAPLVRVVAAV